MTANGPIKRKGSASEMKSCKIEGLAACLEEEIYKAEVVAAYVDGRAVFDDRTGA